MNDFYVRKENKIAKVALIILIFSAIFWLGALNVRDIITNEIMIMEKLEFRPNINPMVERSVMSLIAKSSTVVLGSYLLVWISGVIYLWKTNLVLKKNGWLLMSAILFYIFTPVEIYTGFLDGKMIYLDYFTQGDFVEFRKLLVHRIAALSGASRIAQLCYYTIIVITVLQPFKKN
ncbi:MAG: hypothetical protein IGBAC_1233 [Ignavibacteriae bacterium]|nr:MAG: hypothetical protein IGBAC_1233 [Ignavibacteriota bacterium]